MTDFKLSYDDVSIIPERLSSISSRSECDPYDENYMLPIFAAPMDTVVCKENINEFLDNKINVVVPRTIELNERIKIAYDRNCFFAVSIKEAEKIADQLEGYPTDDLVLMYARRHYKICVDIANGHMERLLRVCRRLKSQTECEITLMTGNIANPETYIDYEEAGVDYIRVGIGGGSACLTASNTGIYAPYFSLLKDIYEIRQRMGGKAKIIADGNIKAYRDIQKALVYADYVMIGGLFNKAIESAGKTTYGKRYWNINGNKIFRPITTLFTYGKEIPRKKFPKVMKQIKDGKLVVWKQYRGMSTKGAQAAIDKNAKLKTAEGKVFYQKVEYDLKGWTENETDYLRSAMSYTNSRKLDEYKESKYAINMSVAYNR